LLRQLLLISALVTTVAFSQEAQAGPADAPAPTGESSYSREVTHQLNIGTMMLRDNKLTEARQAFQKAVELEPKCHEAWNNIGLTYYREGNLDKAGDAYMSAIEIEPGFVPSITNLGAVRHQQRKLDKATGLYRLALDLSDGRDPEIQYNYANVLRDQKDYKKAQEHYLKSIELRPDFPAAHNGLGATYFCLQKFNDAEREIKQAIKLKPDYALAYYHLGLLQTAQKKFPEAIKAYEQSLEHEDRKDYANDTRDKIAKLKEMMNRGTVASVGPPQIGTYQNDKVVPLQTNGMSGAAEIFETKVGNAAKRMERMMKSGSNDPVEWNNCGLLLLHDTNPARIDEAINAFKTSIKLSKGSVYQARYNLAQAYKEKGDFVNAEKECNKAIETARAQSKICPLAHNLRAILLKQKMHFDSADQEYKLAIAQSMGKYPVFHYNRGILLEKMNKPKEAKSEYKFYIDKAPSGVNLMKAKLRLGLLSI
jgi:tetratricopeptide (TPR) repeat protein